MDATAFALSDAVRRDILLHLRRGPLSAGEIAARFPISRPAVSRHLRVLREAGLAVDERAGRRRLYRLNTSPLAELQGWIGRLRDPWSPALDALETEVHRTRRERRGGAARSRSGNPNHPEEKSA